MSKAFRQEDGATDGEPLVPARRHLDRKRPITAEGRTRIEHELAELTAERARLGHLPDSLESSLRQAEIQRRILQLAATLEDTDVPHAEGGTKDRVIFGASVTVEDEQGHRSTYQLVGPDEVNVGERRISIESPLARALIGRSVGEWVTVERPRDNTTLRVLSVSGRPEATLRSQSD